MRNAFFLQECAEQFCGQQLPLGQNIFIQGFTKGNAQDNAQEFKMLPDDRQGLFPGLVGSE